MLLIPTSTAQRTAGCSENRRGLGSDDQSEDASSSIGDERADKEVGDESSGRMVNKGREVDDDSICTGARLIVGGVGVDIVIFSNVFPFVLHFLPFVV